MSTSEIAAEAQAHDQGKHGSVAFYWTIAGILGVITAVEVAVFYIDALEPALAPILLTLSAVKFAMVVMFFMHLKFDSKVFTGVFVIGLSIGTFVVVALIMLYQFLPRLQG